MANVNAPRDENAVPTALFAQQGATSTVAPGQIDQLTGRVLVDATGLANSFAVGEVVSGSGTSWTLAHTPVAGTVALFGQGQRLFLTTDYTISGGNITTVNSWLAGKILADYQY